MPNRDAYMQCMRVVAAAAVIVISLSGLGWGAIRLIDWLRGYTSTHPHNVADMVLGAVLMLCVIGAYALLQVVFEDFDRRDTKANSQAGVRQKESAPALVPIVPIVPVVTLEPPKERNLRLVEPPKVREENSLHIAAKVKYALLEKDDRVH